MLFGTGLRTCIGRRFALHEMALELTMIVHQYILSRADPGTAYRSPRRSHLKPSVCTATQPSLNQNCC
ncbi:cytochrome P450 [Mycobacterium leprae]|uniref:cytochrome P450 n=1 Tax=Mycobacterium leprae TaxID=1769 RepID=UPI000E67815A